MPRFDFKEAYESPVQARRPRGTAVPSDNALSPAEQYRASAWKDRWSEMELFTIAKPDCAAEAGPRWMPAAECYDHRSIAWRRWIRREHSEDV